MRIPSTAAHDASIEPAVEAASRVEPESVSVHADAGTARDVCIAVESLDAYFGAARVVRDVSFQVETGRVTAIIGPSGCGKSTLLRCINRMHETVPAARVEGEIRFQGRDIYERSVSAISVRRHIGMVFQRPTPFPTMSIRENVAAGLKVLPRSERPSRRETDDIVERALRRAALWDEVHDRLGASAVALSGGQQQRLCIARALATSPAVLLLDEPTASLDPISTQRVEELVYELREQVTIVIAFVRADGALGREVCRADDEVDAMHNSMFRILVTHMMEDARTITPSLELLLVSRNLERVADLATNIGEDAVFLAEGKQIKHHAEEQELAASAVPVRT